MEWFEIPHNHPGGELPLSYTQDAAVTVTPEKKFPWLTVAGIALFLWYASR